MTRRPKLSPGERVEIVRRYLAGESIREIAAGFECVTHGAVASIIRRGGIRRPVASAPSGVRHPRRRVDRTSSGIPRTYDAFGIPMPYFAWLDDGPPAGADDDP